MKAKDDHYTVEMFVKRRPGRPRKVNAMTVAQRVAKHRANKKTEAVSVTCNGNSSCNTCSNFGVCSGFSAIGQLGHKG